MDEDDDEDDDLSIAFSASANSSSISKSGRSWLRKLIIEIILLMPRTLYILILFSRGAMFRTSASLWVPRQQLASSIKRKAQTFPRRLALRPIHNDFFSRPSVALRAEPTEPTLSLSPIVPTGGTQRAA
uniref:Uncharacterized protein n=1 Tax=Lotharella globosa TaxID=91324 RepID=A0A7S3ZE64_9EUKA